MAAMLVLLLAGLLVVAALTVGLAVLIIEGIPRAWNRRTGITEALRAHPGILWALAVAAIYAGATYVRVGSPGPDRMMLTAANLIGGASLPPALCGTNDVVMIGGRCYEAMSIGPMLAYLPLVPFAALYGASRWLVSAAFGILAAWLCLPLARRYGPPGATWWLAALGAFGTLLFPLAVEGNFYYLAHLEAMAATFVALIEWRGRRRPSIIAGALGVAALARPTVLLAAIPFGLALVWGSRGRLRAAAVYAVPLAAAVALMAAYDYLRFGSATETGYATSVLRTPGLDAVRDQGLFALSHLAPNLALFIGGGFGVRDSFPWLVASNEGQSILLTTPAVLVAFGAGLRRNWTLWSAAVLAAIPVFLYYGGGGADTYGYRYALDFTPFLLALVAIAVRDHFGGLERTLIIASIAFCSYGFIWAAFG
jgi:hypothetical protein